jgi:hypothetical protein
MNNRPTELRFKVMALLSLAPEASHIMNTEGIEWLSPDIPQPTTAEITAEISRLQAEYDSKQYARDRATAYPSLTEQADMAYWDRQNNTTTLDDAISAVKLQFPKG